MQFYVFQELAVLMYVQTGLLVALLIVAAMILGRMNNAGQRGESNGKSDDPAYKYVPR